MRGLLVIASTETGESVRAQIAESAPLQVKSVTGARMALAAVGEVRPYAILVENGVAPMQALQAVRNMSELTLSRKVPIVIFNGPLEPGIKAQRETFGIAHVLDGEFVLQEALDALRDAVGKIDRLYHSSKVRERLRTASDQLKPFRPEEAGNVEDGGQDFAADDEALDEKPDKRDSPTWDGSVGD